MQDNAPENEMTPADRELEAALSSLRPQEMAVKAEELIFQAGLERGRREARSRQSRWQLATAAAAVLALGAGVASFLRPPAERIVRLVQVEQPKPPAVDQQPATGSSSPPVAVRLDRFGLAPPAGSYLSIRNQVLTRGLDALPRTKSAPAEPEPTVEQLLQSLPRG